MNLPKPISSSSTASDGFSGPCGGNSGSDAVVTDAESPFNGCDETEEGIRITLDGMVSVSWGGFATAPVRGVSTGKTKASA